MSQSEHELLDLLKFDFFKFEQYFLTTEATDALNARR